MHHVCWPSNITMQIGSELVCVLYLLPSVPPAPTPRALPCSENTRQIRFGPWPMSLAGCGDVCLCSRRSERGAGIQPPFARTRTIQTIAPA
ncbi:hypothetical protein L211DRAFT_611864 [Terfezia boudieri ATCC MYA-4762]|uniref:Uncharacterized protein n=1 Tax=Terfezia boudieri ATCC MYA-4762 TaxID=1051890 RepID=A0A3N4LWB0_9PEZI|nr:hypothetical protein L211DRAFT_611864 [Terfezia boudieri ATCC MYA-4762]